MTAGLLGVLTAWSPTAMAASAHASMACPAAQSEAHRPLLKSADQQVEAGQNEPAARTFVAAFDAMDLADRVGSTGKFAADRAVTSYLEAWQLTREVSVLRSAETFLLRYLEVLEQGTGEGCTVVPRRWADEKLAEVRALIPEEPETPPEDAPEIGPKPAKDCPAAPAIIGVDRVGVALVTIGAGLFVSGTAFLLVGLVDGDLSANPGQGFAIAGGVLMGSGVAFLIPGAVRLASWKRRQNTATRLGVAPFTGRGLAGLSVSGRFGARR